MLGNKSNKLRLIAQKSFLPLNVELLQSYKRSGLFQIQSSFVSSTRARTRLPYLNFAPTLKYTDCKRKGRVEKWRGRRSKSFANSWSRHSSRRGQQGKWCPNPAGAGGFSPNEKTHRWKWDRRHQTGNELCVVCSFVLTLFSINQLKKYTQEQKRYSPYRVEKLNILFFWPI